MGNRQLSLKLRTVKSNASQPEFTIWGGEIITTRHRRNAIVNFDKSVPMRSLNLSNIGDG